MDMQKMSIPFSSPSFLPSAGIRLVFSCRGRNRVIQYVVFTCITRAVGYKETRSFLLPFAITDQQLRPQQIVFRFLSRPRTTASSCAPWKIAANCIWKLNKDCKVRISTEWRLDGTARNTITSFFLSFFLPRHVCLFSRLVASTSSRRLL